MSSRSRSVLALLTLTLSGALLMHPDKSASQEPGGDNGYRTTESSALDLPGADQGYSVAQSAADKAGDKGDLRSEGPVRMARFAYVSGNVTWRDGPTGEWSQAKVNMPIRQAAEILVLKGGRADVQFDDGSELRLGNGALVTLKTLYSDSKGEFTQIELKEGLATLHSRHPDSVYQIDTPIVAVKSVGPVQVRLGVGRGSEITVQMGSANVEGPQGKTVVKEGNYVYLASNASPYQMKPSPAPDTWDRWNGDRNQLLAGGPNTNKHVPSNIGLVAGDLDTYGTWHQDATNGWVWSPNNQPPDWRPYKDGRWVWEDPFGWTWVSNEPWGWAPYHYGTWFQGDQGWSWCPGPYSQYWSPGVVSFSDYGGDIGWAPLCPWEVSYPAFCGLGIWGAGWGLDFSIGWCGCYFPFGGGFCLGNRWDNGFCNGFRDHGGFGNRFGDHGGFGNNGGFGNRGGFGPGARSGNRAGSGFVPTNARNGTTTARRSAFGGSGSYQAAKNGSSMFGGGHTVGAPGRGTMTSGPSSVQPSAASRTASRSFTSSRPSQSAEGRGTYQGSLPSNVARSIGSERSAGFAGSSFRSGAGMSAAEAANSARSSLGYTGHGGFGSTGAGRSFGSQGYGGRRSFGGYSGSTRSYGEGGYGYSGGRSYGGGGYSGGGRGGGFSGGGGRGGGFSGGGHGGGGFSGGGHGGGGFSGGGGHGGGGGGGHR